MKWNVLHDATVAECFQSKPSRLKLCAFLAAPHRHADWTVDFGDYLVFDRGMTIFAPDDDAVGKCYLLPELATANSGTKLSSYIKGMQLDGLPGSLKKYSDAGCAVPSLPPEPTAAGLRPGAVDTLACSVPAELAIHNTGHDMTGMSAFFEYLNSRVSLTIPGLVALIGWHPFRYGQIGARVPGCPR